MLVFTSDCDVSKEVKEKFERELAEMTGKKCVVVPLCSSVAHVPSQSQVKEQDVESREMHYRLMRRINYVENKLDTAKQRKECTVLAVISGALCGLSASAIIHIISSLLH